MFKRVPGAVLALTLGLTLAACGGGTTGATSPLASPTASPTAGSSTAADHNAVDVMFATMMIPHHQGAIEMSDLALSQASTQQVRDLAGRIKAAQTPQIEQMQAWLAAWGAAMPMSSIGADTDSNMGGHGMGSMGGSDDPISTSPSTDDFGMGAMMSMSESDMTTLRAATGVDFDKLFLQQMIAHHQGAIDMAGVETARGENPQALALAAAITSSQTAEIAQMQQLLSAL